MHCLQLVKTSIAAGLAIGVLGGHADAQTVCGERSAIVQQLRDQYGETRRSVGVQQGRGVVEIYASEETGSWTILLTNARGTTCLMAAGEAFEAMIETASDTGSPI